MTAVISSTASRTDGDTGPRPRRLTWERLGVYAFLIVAALFFLLPIYVMVATSLKPMAEIRNRKSDQITLCLPTT